jgi:hypothetical protein
MRNRVEMVYFKDGLKDTTCRLFRGNFRPGRDLEGSRNVRQFRAHRVVDSVLVRHWWGGYFPANPEGAENVT